MAKRKFKTDVSIEAGLALPNKIAGRALIIDNSNDVVESSITAAELALLAGVSSNVQTQLDAKIASTEKGAANGVATLDANSKIPTAQLPALAITDVFVVADIAARDALVIGAGDGEVQEGDVIIVTDAGSGQPDTFIYDGATYQILQKPADLVSSVNGQTGVVLLDSDDISEGAVNLYYTSARFDAAFAGKDSDDLSEGTTNLYHTDERSQDAVGNILTDSSSIDFNYDDGIPSISAQVLPAGVDHDSLQNFVANEHIDHSGVEIATAADSGLTGGGDITSTRNLSVDINNTSSEASVDSLDEFLIYDVSASALKKVTKDALLDGVGAGSAGDIGETSAAFVDNQATPANVVGLAFANGVVRSFEVQAVVERGTTFEVHTLKGVQLSAGWDLSIDATGDDAGVTFSINASGQVQYISTSTGDAGDIKFRAETLSV